MALRSTISILVFLTASGAYASQECAHQRTIFKCVKYIRNYDADTITVEIPGVHPLLGENASVRVHGIDAPEVRSNKPCEKESARIAKNLVEATLKRAKRIDLVNVSRDKYFRILADVIADGTNLKEILLRNQLAYEYDGGTKKKVDWCLAIKKADSPRKPADQ